MVFNKSSYLHQSGWIKSFVHRVPQNQHDSPLPWMNYNMISLLDERLNVDLILFEFGSGYSTLFYANKVKNVVSVESDQRWQRKIARKLPDNAKITYVDADIEGDYSREITRSGAKFDVVVIDGRDRVNCMKTSLDCLSDRGVIILDDSSRHRYAKAFNMARTRNFRSLSFQGLKPTDFETHETTLFYRDDNCFGL